MSSLNDYKGAMPGSLTPSTFVSLLVVPPRLRVSVTIHVPSLSPSEAPYLNETSSDIATYYARDISGVRVATEGGPRNGNLQSWFAGRVISSSGG